MDLSPRLQLPVRAAVETAANHGIAADRCVILQDGNTLVLRLSETLVARVVTDREGPRKGMDWFTREIEIAAFLAGRGAPVIPIHPDIPPGPHECHGYALNFWKFVQAIPGDPPPTEIGRTLRECHRILGNFPGKLPELAILTETAGLLDSLEEKALFPSDVIALLRTRLADSTAALRRFPHQPLHGDAHMGNLMDTTEGLLWTDWEDTFSGPIEWDLASIIWNARILDGDRATTDAILSGYADPFDERALHHSLIARAAVMSAWYPILYPEPSEERKAKLQARLDWLASDEPESLRF